MVDAMSAFRDALPVDLEWLPWGDEALERSREGELPVAVVLGEACDHWSGRLARELRADDEVRELLRECYVCVAAEPTDQPALAARVQQVLSLHGAQGWPAVAVLLPGGAFVGAVPYAPLRDGAKRAGLARVLLDLAQAWRDHRSDLEREAAHAAGILAELGALGAEAGLPAPKLTLDRVEAAAMAVADELEGGFGPPPRFHQPALVGFLLARCSAPGCAPALRSQLQRGFDALLAGAVHDHLAGGFFRGATDAAWARPFCDKRLLDNAQLVDLLLSADAILGGERFRAAADGALGWCLGALGHADGGCVSGLLADSPGDGGVLIDGACYAWSEAAAAEIVGREGAELFARRYLCDERGALDPEGEFRFPALRGEVAASERERLPAIVRRLAVARDERPQPARDERRRAGEQGLLLRALSRAAVRDDAPPAWREAALRTLLVIREQLTVDGRLRASDIDDAGEAAMGDRARCARGLLAWAELDGDAVARNQGLLWAEELAAQLTIDAQVVLADPLIEPPVVDALDRPDAPSSAAVLGELLLDAHAVSGGREWLHAARRLVEAHAGALRAAPLAAAGLCLVWHRLEQLEG